MCNAASMRDSHQPAAGDLALTDVLYALSDPTRLQIAARLAGTHEQACGAFGLPIAKATLSHHLKVLRDAGVIRTRGEGTQRLNALRRDDLEQRFPGLLDAVLAAAAAMR
jgi:DNA-binding transcriptional ArsR family regulator